MGERTRAFDWSRTPVGRIADWPQSLKIAVRIMLDSRYAMWLGWGPDFTFFYNDAYAKMTLGPKHPWALGRSAREVWSEIWQDIGPRAESVVRTGQATWDEGLLLFLERRGFPEETYHTFSYSPIPDDAGGVGGMLCVVTEDTERTIGERRLRTLRDLAARTTEEARSADEACRSAGRGSEFVVRLPAVDAASASQAGTQPAPPTRSRRILVVDDHRDGADTLVMMLQVSGNEVRGAYDGEQGLTVAEEFRPDVVLLDIGMPRLNGYEACRRLREKPWGKDVFVIALTGWGQDEDRRQSEDAGFDHHLVKPVEPQALLDLLASLKAARA